MLLDVKPLFKARLIIKKDIPLPKKLENLTFKSIILPK